MYKRKEYKTFIKFNKLSKYFSWKLPNSETMNISEFVKVLWNLEIEWDFISEYGAKFWSVKTDYDNLFLAIYNSDNWENKIYKILQYFELSKSFLEVIDYTQEIEAKNHLSEIKKLLVNILKKFKTWFELKKPSYNG